MQRLIPSISKLRDGAQVEAANQKELVRNTEAMFKNISEYIQGELLGTPNWMIEYLFYFIFLMFFSSVRSDE